MNFNTEEELIHFTKSIIGKKFGDIDKLELLKKNTGDKGILGKVVETGFYGYPLNNDCKADFDSLGIELKVTGFIKNKNGSLAAKERMSLSQINFTSIINDTFEFSKFLYKNKKILIIWYQFEKDKPKSDFKIKYYQLYDMEQDLEIIRNDFILIQSKVINGEAHLLSDGDTSYLGASTKGAKGELVKQPNSKIMARPRAFSLKNSYMRGILNGLSLEQFSINVPQLFNTVEEYIRNQLQPYFGLTQKQIWKGITNEDLPIKIPKSLNKMISNRIIGNDKDLATKHELFKKTNYVIKNLPINENLVPLEKFTFKSLALNDFEDTWEDSEWKLFFEEVTFILVLYEGKTQGNRILKDIKKITFTADDISLFEKTYNAIKDTIQTKNLNKLPRAKVLDKNPLKQPLVLSTKGQAGDKAYLSFFDNNKTKTCFMIEKEFMIEKIKNC